MHVPETEIWLLCNNLSIYGSPELTEPFFAKIRLLCNNLSHYGSPELTKPLFAKMWLLTFDNEAI
jgi:hypothetical protein